MPPPRRESSAGGKHFSFANSPGNKSGDDAARLDGNEYDAWTQRVKGSYNHFGRSSDLKFGAWTQRIAGNYRDSGNPDGTEFKWLAQQEGDNNSGDTSPTLWKKTSSPKHQADESYPISNNYPHHHGNHLYPTSRSQAIAKYRQEMMEMVQDVPESGYELSLRDLVELPKKARPKEEILEEERGPSDDATQREKKDQKKIKKGKKQILRSESMDSGVFLLKMFFPISLGVKRRNSGAAGAGSKVSPKPILSENERGGSGKSANDDWGKKNGYSEMSRSTSTNSSGRGRRKMGGCYPFF